MPFAVSFCPDFSFDALPSAPSFGSASPSEVSGLADGDIYIRRSPNVDRTFEGNVNVAGNLKLGSTTLTEADLIALLALLD